MGRHNLDTQLRHLLYPIPRMVGVLIFCSSVAFADAGALRVGVIVPISGEFAKYGTGIVRAMELAASEVSGRAITLEIEDNRSCQSGDAVSAFHKLNRTKSLDVLVTFCTGAAQGVLPLAQARKIPFIQLWSQPSKMQMHRLLKDSLPR